jgi:L-lactate dehydrogenase
VRGDGGHLEALRHARSRVVREETWHRAHSTIRTAQDGHRRNLGAAVEHAAREGDTPCVGTDRIGLVGAGAVGSAALLSVVLRRCAREVVVVDRDQARETGVVVDVAYGAVLSPGVDVREGDLPDLAGAALVMIAAGVNERAGGATDRGDPEGRLRLLGANAAIYREILPELHRVAPDTVVLVLTDPPVPLADLARAAGFTRVLSSGTFLDSLRFRFHLAARLGVDAASVDAAVLGEHGTSQVLAWSTARVGGVPLADALPADVDAAALREQVEHDVRYANIAIIEGTGASQYGIGMAAARIAEIVLRDERAVIPVGSYSERYGVTLSLPSVVGRQGVERVLDPALTADEQESRERPAAPVGAARARHETAPNAPPA